MNQTIIEQMEPWLGEEEKRAVAEYLEGQPWLTEFRKTAEFERMIADHAGSRCAVVTSSGTGALFTALASCGVGPGDEVIVPDFTMIASANAVLLAGGKPVLVDVGSADLCLDLELAERAITGRTRAMVLVSLNGRAPDMPRVLALAAKYSLVLVEDAAQSLGSRQKGKHLGTFGRAGIFSFSPMKVITTGQGGALVTDDPEVAERARRFKDFGRSQGSTDYHEAIGYNFKFTDLQAVIGIEQMKKLAWRVARKKEMFALYRSELAGVPGVEFCDTDLSETAPWFMDALVNRRDELMNHLSGRGIKTRAFYPPVHRQPPYRTCGEYEVADDLGARGLWLPSSSFLTDGDVRRVCDAIRTFYVAPG